MEDAERTGLPAAPMVSRRTALKPTGSAQGEGVATTPSSSGGALPFTGGTSIDPRWGVGAVAAGATIVGATKGWQASRARREREPISEQRDDERGRDRS